MKRLCSTGEPCALKDASTVRGGAVGNVLSYETTRKDFGGSKDNSNALAAYSTNTWNLNPAVALILWDMNRHLITATPLQVHEGRNSFGKMQLCIPRQVKDSRWRFYP